MTGLKIKCYVLNDKFGGIEKQTLLNEIKNLILGIDKTRRKI